MKHKIRHQSFDQFKWLGNFTINYQLNQEINSEG
jgi:hypothetical protein